MRVMIANTWYYPHMMGGAEQSVLLLAEGLQKTGYSVSVITCDAEKETIVETINGVKVYRCHAGKYNLYEAYKSQKNLVGKIINKYYEIINKEIQTDIQKVIDEEKPDIVHVNCFSGLSFLLFQTVKKNQIPVIYTARNFFVLFPILEASLRRGRLRSLLQAIYRMSTRKFLQNIDLITAPSEFTIRKLENNNVLQNCKKLCIPNCIDTEVDITRQLLEKKKEKCDEKIRFMYAGWIIEDKGIHSLLSAFNSLHNENAELILCGDGKLVDLVKSFEEKNKNIHYLGKLTKDQLSVQYQTSDVLIVPSLCEETFGRVVIEGASYGLPIISSDRGALPEVVGTLKNGIIYEAGNSNDLLTCLVKMCDEKQRNEYRKNIEKNIGRYSIGRQIEDYLDVYKKLIDGANI